MNHKSRHSREAGCCKLRFSSPRASRRGPSAGSAGTPSPYFMKVYWLICNSPEGGNPLQINNLVQVVDARLLGHDNIEVFCLKWKFMN